MDLIYTDRLTKIYNSRMKRGNVVALEDVSLSVHPGEIFALVGPNGAGKTTLVKSLLGIVRPTSGTVHVQGMSPDDPLSRERVGFLGENNRFPSHLTGNELLRMTGDLYGLPVEQTEKRTQELLPLVGMEKWGEMQIGKYSKGMTQRIGLAQAMLADPDLIILDEPTDGVDPQGRVEIRQVLLRLREQGKTIFLNSHLLSEVESVADRVAIVARGRLLKLSSMADLTRRKNQYRIEADIRDQLIEIPAILGNRVSVSATELVVELHEREYVTKMIDELRLRKITIYSITPITVSLEQTFLELISGAMRETTT